MKTLVIALLITMILAVMFIIGIVTTQTALSVSAFCLWTPAIVTLGYAIGRLGLKVSIQSGAR